MERGKQSVSATTHTEAIKQKRRMLKQNAKNMKGNKDLEIMGHHSISKEPEGEIKNLGLYKDPLYKRVIDFFNPLKAGSPSFTKKLGHMSFSDKS